MTQLESRRIEIFSDYSRLLTLSIPVLLSSLIFNLVSVTDTAMMGRVSVTGLAGVALGGSIYQVLINFIYGATTGHEVLAAKYFGARRLDMVQSSLMHSLIFALFVATVSFVSIQVTMPLLIDQMTVSKDIGTEATLYVQYIAILLIINPLFFLLRSTLVMHKSTKWTLYASVVITATNAVLDYLLIFGWGPIPRLGTLGNALSSVFAGSLGFVTLLVGIRRVGLMGILDFSTISLRRGQLTEIARLSVPAMISQLFDYLATMIVFVMLAHIGTRDLAGGRIVFNIMLLVFSILSSLSIGGQITVGRNLGAGNVQSAMQFWRRSQEVVIVCATLVAVLLLIFGDPVLKAFTGFTDVREISKQSLLLLGWVVPVIGWCCANIWILRAIGKTKWDMYVNVLSTWLLMLPASYLFARILDLGVLGLFIGFTIYWSVRAIVSYALVWQSFSKMQRLT